MLAPRDSTQGKSALKDVLRFSESDKFMADDAEQRARDLIERLRQQGHHAEADSLAHHLAQDVERGFLFALREACETILTAIEAIDPVTQTMIEELRVDVEKWLRPPAGRA
jgi:DNA-directed RNA polymerase specialized sigma54-like protein